MEQFETEEEVTFKGTKLTEIPPLSQILGLQEGQIMLYKNSYSGDMKKVIITELYDEHIIMENEKSTYKVDLKNFEKLVEEGYIIVLKKDKKPVLGKRILFGLKYFRKWDIRVNKNQ